MGRGTRRRPEGYAVVYINTDGNGRGFLNAGGSHSLERFVNAVARDITDPETGISVWKRRQARTIARGTPEERKRRATGPTCESTRSGPDRVTRRSSSTPASRR